MVLFGANLDAQIGHAAFKCIESSTERLLTVAQLDDAWLRLAPMRTTPPKSRDPPIVLVVRFCEGNNGGTQLGERGFDRWWRGVSFVVGVVHEFVRWPGRKRKGQKTDPLNEQSDFRMRKLFGKPHNSLQRREISRA